MTSNSDHLTRFFDPFNATLPESHRFEKLNDGFYYGLQQPNHLNITVLPGRVMVTYYGKGSYRLHGYSNDVELGRMLGYLLQSMPPKCPAGPWH